MGAPASKGGAARLVSDGLFASFFQREVAEAIFSQFVTAKRFLGSSSEQLWTRNLLSRAPHTSPIEGEARPQPYKAIGSVGIAFYKRVDFYVGLTFMLTHLYVIIPTSRYINVNTSIIKSSNLPLIVLQGRQIYTSFTG